MSGTRSAKGIFNVLVQILNILIMMLFSSDVIKIKSGWNYPKYNFYDLLFALRENSSSEY